MSAIAIDFGTTNSVVATWDEAANAPALLGLPELSIMQPDRPPLVPSLAYVQDNGQLVFGQAVRDLGLDQRQGMRLFRNFKRSLVNNTLVTPLRGIDGREWRDDEIAQHFLRAMLSALPIPRESIDQLVMTAPVAAFQDYVRWLQAVADERVRVIDESTAAALGYGLTEPEALVLVFDMGGGTLDLSLVKLPASSAHTGKDLGSLVRENANHYRASVITKAGYNLGGSDVDRWLLEYVKSQVESIGEDDAALLTHSEQAKIALSSFETTYLQTGNAALPISRADLRQILEQNGFFVGLHRTIDRVLMAARQQGIFKEDIAYVLMVGGMAMMPAVQETLNEYFERIPVRAEKPFTAVVEGALQVARGYGLADTLAHSYGLRHLDAATGSHQYDELVPMGTPYPLSKPIEISLGAAHANQEQIELVIGEIDGTSVTQLEVKYQDGQAVFVAQAGQQTGIQALNAEHPTLLALNPVAQPGEDRLKASFTIDGQRRLHVTVVDLQTRKTLTRNKIVATLR